MNRQIAEELAFNFRAYGRNGRGDRIQLTPAQARMVARTVARTPEVMVKVLSSGAASAKAVQRHIDYVARKGEVELHTDEPHPHVHVIVKSIGDDGRRLNIRKAQLKEWRSKFAAHLRELGVAANATPRQFRGLERRHLPLAVHWMGRRQDAQTQEFMAKAIGKAMTSKVRAR